MEKVKIPDTFIVQRTRRSRGAPTEWPFTPEKRSRQPKEESAVEAQSAAPAKAAKAPVNGRRVTRTVEVRGSKYDIEVGVEIPPRRWASKPGGRPNSVLGLLRALKRKESVWLAYRVSQASNAAQTALGRGNYAARPEGTGSRVWRLK